MDDFFEQAVELARNLSPGLGGMASVKTEFNPYECKYYSEANWSSNQRIVSDNSDSPMDSLLDLIDKLKEMQ